MKEDSGKPKKNLSPRIGNGIWLTLDYVNVRCMETKQIIFGKPFGFGFMTVKPIHENGIQKELQIHVRFKDKESRIWDVDAYVPLAEIEKLENQIMKWKTENHGVFSLRF